MAHPSTCIVTEAHSDADCREESGLTPVMASIASELRETRAQMLAMARNPGLTGINKTRGVETLDDVIEDIVRAVARKLIPAGENLTYARFLQAAKEA